MTTKSSPASQAPRQSLTRAACLALLEPGGHGRVAATMRAVPVIIPVTFTLFGDDVLFVHGQRDGSARALAGSVIAFEADHLGSDGRADWEVHVTGVATPVGLPMPASEFRLSSELVTGWRTDPNAWLG